MLAIISFILLLFTGPAAAEPLNDDAVLTGMFIESLRSLVAESPRDSTGNASVSFEGPVSLNPVIRIRTEAALTHLGFRIVEPGSHDHSSITIAVMETRVIARREKDGLGRYFTLDMRVRETGRDGAIRFAKGETATRTDVIPLRLARTTDTAHTFSPSIERVDAGGGPGRLMTLSFLGITAILAWFAFQ